MARLTVRTAVVALALGAAVASGCGSGDSDSGTSTRQATSGKELFAARCSGCHTLAAAGASGSATDVHRSEKTDGVNFDNRKVSRADVLYAIRHGGFGSRIMPANIVAGADAEKVADFVAENSGTKADAAPDATLASPVAHRMRAPVTTAAAPDPAGSGGQAANAEFLRAAFDSAQELWQRQFQAAGSPYTDAHVVFFHTKIFTPCGEQTAETGPFYCPPAQGVYLNTDFFAALAQAYDLRSGFPAAYVTAHEVGHHIQQLFGLHERIARLDASDPDGKSQRSIALELQADCYAGVWLHELDGAGQLSENDIQEILHAAAVVGDDYQRNRAGAALAPETWTHGSSEQRQRWLTTGMRSGAPAACDTFGTTE
jgi:predicted metalloprotease